MGTVCLGREWVDPHSEYQNSSIAVIEIVRGIINYVETKSTLRRKPQVMAMKVTVTF